MENNQQPIIIRKRKSKKQHAHNSAWKIAFADFATAMMALFLVLWLVDATSIEEKKAISNYFSDPIGFKEGGSRYIIDLGGSGDKSLPGQAASETLNQDDVKKVIDSETVENLAKEIEQKKFEELAKQFKNKIEQDQALEAYKDQVQMNITEEGLKIQIMDKEFRPMFDSGSDEIKAHTTAILKELARNISQLPNKISISGHTDATGFGSRKDYSNWELSTDRANAARRVLTEYGVREQQLERVVGKGSSSLYKPSEPTDPINRRISILILSKNQEQELEERFKKYREQDLDVSYSKGNESNKNKDKNQDRLEQEKVFKFDPDFNSTPFLDEDPFDLNPESIEQSLEPINTLPTLNETTPIEIRSKTEKSKQENTPLDSSNTPDESQENPSTPEPIQVEKEKPWWELE